MLPRPWLRHNLALEESTRLTPALTPGAIPGYRILRPLGAGGMGSVYLAEDESLQRRVAIKVLLDTRAADGQYRQRFRREARAMASLEHPHVVRLYSVGTSSLGDFLVMEYVDGETLAARIARDGALPEREAVRILREILEALEAAATKGIVHRDIKPSNVLLDAHGRARVADFGLAKGGQRPLEDTGLTQDAAVLGTPYYLAPEQALGEPVDFRADIYSAGLVFFEMLTGRRPFEGETPVAVISRRLAEAPPDPRAHVPGVSERLCAIYERMVQRDPANRPATYRALIDDLDDAASTATVVLRKSAATWPVPSARARRLALAALVVAVAAAIYWVGVRPAGSTGRRDAVVTIAVAPFYGPDEESAREGRLAAALIERAITERLQGDDTRVLGIDDTNEVVRNHDAARTLGERLDASLVVWGQAFVTRGEIETQPMVTFVPQRTQSGATLRPMIEGHALDSEGLRGQSQVADVDAANQIDLRKTSARNMGDTVTTLAGLYALYVKRQPERALAYFRQHPPTGESLRYRARALIDLRRRDDALAMAEKAVAADPLDPTSHALLATLHAEAGRFADAAAAYRAAFSNVSIVPEAGFADGDRLYVKETLGGYIGLRLTSSPPSESSTTPYLLGLDRASGRVVQRLVLPGPAYLFAATDDGIEITCKVGGVDKPHFAKVRFVHGGIAGPRPFPTAYQYSLRQSAVALMSEVPWLTDLNAAKPAGESAPAAAATLSLVERRLRAAVEHDPTHIWYRYFLGAVLAAQQRRAEAEEVWGGVLASEPHEPPYEYARMAGFLEWLGERDWADRAYQRALSAMTAFQPRGDAGIWLDYALGAGFLGAAKQNSRRGLDLRRQHLWLQRARELAGPAIDGDTVVARVWAKHFAGEGETELARTEAQYAARVSAHPSSVDGPAFATAFSRILRDALALSLLLAALLVPLNDRHRSWRLLAVAVGLAATATLIFIVSAERLARYYEMPWQYSQRLAAFAPDLEERLRSRDTRPVRYAAAVAQHVAGQHERARELYAGLGADPRARENLAALDRGSAPARALTLDELADALTDGTLLEHFARWRRVLFDWLNFLVFGFALLVVLVLRVVSHLMRGHGGRVRVILRQAVWWVVPGSYDLMAGRMWVGYAALTASTLVLRCLVLTTLNPLASPATLRVAYPVIVEGYPLPTPPGLADSAAVAAHHYWPLFWAYTGSVPTWSAVAAAAIFALGWHLWRLPAIRRAV